MLANMLLAVALTLGQTEGPKWQYVAVGMDTRTRDRYLVHIRESGPDHTYEVRLSNNTQTHTSRISFDCKQKLLRAEGYREIKPKKGTISETLWKYICKSNKE